MLSKDADDTIWMSWHLSRRSKTLSGCLGIPLIAVQYEGGKLLRHARSAAWSVVLLTRLRPRTLFLQYSFLLLVIISLYKALAPYQVTVYCDCHTKALRRKLQGSGSNIFSALKKWSIGSADVVILANSGQIQDLQGLNDRFLIVPDFVPDFRANGRSNLPDPYCVMSMSFDKDEPVAELADAAELIGQNQAVYITGSAPDWYYQRFDNNPSVHVTGFLPDSRYLQLIRHASCVISLTSEEGCLQCAGYEALAFAVPFVTSNTKALREYFGASAIFVDHCGASIAEAANAVHHRQENYRQSMAELKREKELQQKDNISVLRGLLSQKEGETQG